MNACISYSNVHAVAESSRLAATKGAGAHGIVDIKLSADRDNGSIVGKGAFVAANHYAEGTATAFEGKIIAKHANGMYRIQVTEATNAYLVLQVPMIYEQYTQKMQEEKYFYNAQGDIVRAYPLFVGDEFAISAEGIVSGTIAIGATVEVDSTTKLLKIKA